METLRIGSAGPLVQLLQLALMRAGFDPGAPDGIFGAKLSSALQLFQSASRLYPDAVAGSETHAALCPYYTGYKTHTIGRGDSLYRIAMTHGTTVRAIEAANPGMNPLNLTHGAALVVPLPFPVVPVNIDFSSVLISFCCRGIAARYPFVARSELGRSVMGRPLYTPRITRTNG